MIIVSHKKTQNVPSATILGSLATPLLMTLLIISSSTLSATTMPDLNQAKAAEKEIMDIYPNPIVNILANELETRINKSGAILEITSSLPEVKSAPFAS